MAERSKEEVDKLGNILNETKHILVTPKPLVLVIFQYPGK